MGENRLYKYLDAKGGKEMLKNGNLQFTNATDLNDPFDCHPGLMDYSNANTKAAKVFGKELIGRGEYINARTRRNEAWICSLSKNYNSLLMWSYYNNHTGICIGLDRAKTKDSLSHINNGINIGAHEMEVQYKEIIEKPDFFKSDYFEIFKYQLSTKAKAWEHEEEVRFLLIDPWTNNSRHHPCFVYGKESRVYHDISSDSFEALYFGVRINKKDREALIKAAKKLNPEIKIYQMKIDPEAFKLKEELIS